MRFLKLGLFFDAFAFNTTVDSDVRSSPGKVNLKKIRKNYLLHFITQLASHESIDLKPNGVMLKNTGKCAKFL